MLIIYSTYNCVTLTRILSTAKPVFLVVMRYKTIVISSSDMSVIVSRDSPDHIVRLHLTRATQILANMEHAFCRGHLIKNFHLRLFHFYK
jgi:hypothetical protein